jgi:hypothetical protein
MNILPPPGRQDNSPAGKWRRVRRTRLCPVCNKPDWCLFAGPEADPTAAICARVESPKRCGEAGWLHRLRDDSLWRAERRVIRFATTPRPVPPRDLGNLAVAHRQAVNRDRLHALAKSLGLSAEALEALGIGWAAEQHSWSFPMWDAAGCVLGIRLRRPNGFKFSVKGGHEGLFLPSGQSGGRGPLLVGEGPTDTAALLDLGFSDVAGRPSCTGGVKLLVELVGRRRPREVVILADNDAPGRRGADYLASALAAYAPAVRVIAPPAGVKDARAWLQAGGTGADFLRAIAESPKRRLQIRTARVN